ncbi:MAG: hypothetical protein JW963_15625 [Anaerolineales bacterium]|nr:hypothetical protein [Anaerolineales bacterium]
MSKLKIRIILSVLLSLGVIFAVYTSVLGAPLNFFFEKAEAHSASERMTNFNGQIVTEREAYYNQLDAYEPPPAGDGHGCESQYDGPID